jgi:hypothetical protein
MLSLFFSFLVINNGYQAAYVNVNEIQAIEVVDIDDDSGILTITLKGNKVENLAFKCIDKKLWEQTKDFLVKCTYDLSNIVSNKHLDVKLNKDQF